MNWLCCCAKRSDDKEDDQDYSPNALTQPNVLPQRTPHRIHPAIVQQQAINHILYSNIHDVELFCQICYEKNIIGSDGLVNERALRSEFDNFKFYKNLKFDFSTLFEILKIKIFMSSRNGVIQFTSSFIQIQKSIEAQSFANLTKPKMNYVTTLRLEKSTKIKCEQCQLNCSSVVDFVDHLSEHLNKFNLYYSYLTTARSQEFYITYEPSKNNQEVCFKIFRNELQVKNVFIVNSHNKISLQFNKVLDAKDLWATKVSCNKMFFEKDKYKYSFLIHAINKKCNKQILEHHHIWINNSYLVKKTAVIGETELKYRKLGVFVTSTVDVNSTENRELRRQVLNPSNYVDVFKSSIHLEDRFNEDEFIGYDLQDQTLMRVSLYPLRYKLSLKSISHLPAKMEAETFSVIYLINMNCIDKNHVKKGVNATNQYVIEGKFERYTDNKDLIIRITRRETLLVEHPHNQRYFVRFLPNRTSIRWELQALESAKRLNLCHLMFPESTRLTSLANDSSKINKFEWVNENVSINQEQEQAIRNIVNGVAYPAPYILYGPPGTGKTTTIVEAICQIRKLKSSSNVLIATSSNFACDEIGTRLLKFIPKDDLLRIYSSTVAKNEEKNQLVDHFLARVSNLDSDNSESTKYLEIFMKHRIVLTTLCKSGSLNMLINKKYFEYLIIDECGGATEPQTLIPIAEVVSSSGVINANIVLSGDPQQLGPFVKNYSDDRLKTPWISRLMKTPLYRRRNAGKLNERVITKLIRNFRTNAAILKLPNELFYENELEYHGRPEIIDCCLYLSILPNKNFPLIFHSVNGICYNRLENPSYFNRVEIDLVIDYIGVLLSASEEISQHDIGVATFYRKQCTEIRLECKTKKWCDIEIDTIEQYRGREKKIIILSAVRSNCGTSNNNIGILGDYKCFNVAITRARALLIVCGNADTLSKHKNWINLIDYCKKNNSFIE